MVQNRNYGLDIARICAMCGIIILHILGAGGMIDYTTGDNPKYWLVWWLEICAYCSVDLFAMLSGWLGIKKRQYSTYRILELVAIVLFYCILITILFALVQPDVFASKLDIIKSCLPYMFGRYWYIMCYIPIVILQPFINKMLLALSKEQHRKLCFVSIFIFALIPTFFNNDFFAFNRGYSFVWLVICYAIGSYLKREENIISQKISKIKCVITFIVCSLGLLVLKILYDFVFHVDGQYFIEYTSPVVLLMAVVALLCMSQLKIKVGKNIFAKMSMMAFDVYVIHCHILVLDKMIYDKFRWIGDVSIYMIPVITICIVILIYFVLSVIAMIRSAVFENILINKVLKKIAVQIDKQFYVINN